MNDYLWGQASQFQMDYTCYTVLNTVTGYLGQDEVQHEQRQQAGGGQQVGPQQVQDEAATTSGNIRELSNSVLLWRAVILFLVMLHRYTILVPLVNKNKYSLFIVTVMT